MFVLVAVYNALPWEEAKLKHDIELEFGERLIEIVFPKLSDKDIRKRKALTVGLLCSRQKDWLDHTGFTYEDVKRETNRVVPIMIRHMHNRCTSVQMDEDESDNFAISI